MDREDGVWTVAQLIERIHVGMSGPQQNESSLRMLLDLMGANADARAAVSCHPQAVPLLVGILWSGSTTSKILACMVIEILSRREETRIKILLGGSIPAIFALLKSGTRESQITAAQALHALSKASNGDKVGSKIFSTEDILPYLWNLLSSAHTTAEPLDGLLVGTLRNLSNDSDNFWDAAADAGALGVLLQLLSLGSIEAQRHSCFLLATMILKEDMICTKVMQSGCIDRLLKLLCSGADFQVRAEAAGVLKALSQVSQESRELIVKLNGISALIGATVAPYKEVTGGEGALLLQENALGALANISGGLHSIIQGLADRIDARESSHNISDNLGALAYALMVFDEKDASMACFPDPLEMEQILINQIKSPRSTLIKERSIEALASLYGNKCLAGFIMHSETKNLLIGLITMTAKEVQAHLLKWLVILRSRDADLWHAMEGRQGIQLLISFLGVSSDVEQDCAVALLSLLCQENGDSNWAVTAAGGIPPLIQLLNAGSLKAKQDSATILGNLCVNSEDIRLCVDKAGAEPALLWLLKNADLQGQEIAARTLKNLVRQADATTVSQLNAMLTGQTPVSKLYVFETLGHFLSISPLSDILLVGSPTNNSFQALLRMLASFKEVPQQQAVSVLAKLLVARQDLSQISIFADMVTPLHKLLSVQNDIVTMHAAQCLAVLFGSMDENAGFSKAASQTVAPLVMLCSSEKMEVLEPAIFALSNLFCDKKLAVTANVKDLLISMTRVLMEGSLQGRVQAAKGLTRLLKVKSIDDALIEKIQELGTILALIKLLNTANDNEIVTHAALEALLLLAHSIKMDRPSWQVLFQNPHVITPLVRCVETGQVFIRDMAIQILSRFCEGFSANLRSLLSDSERCVAALAERVIEAPNLQVRVEAASLLVCAAKEDHQRAMRVITEANCLLELVHSLLEMLAVEVSFADDVDFRSKLKSPSYCEDLHLEDCSAINALFRHGKTMSLWLLSIICSYNDGVRHLMTEQGAIETVTKEISCCLNSNQGSLQGPSDVWVGALLLTILFQDKDVLELPSIRGTITVLTALLTSDIAAARYFAGQALTKLLVTDDQRTILALAESEAPLGLVYLLANAETDTEKYQDMVHQFFLVPNPAQTALEHLFTTKCVKAGFSVKKVIPALIELLTPNAERPSAPFFAERLLTSLALENCTSKLEMAEGGLVEALTTYLSLGPKDNMEVSTVNLMQILFSSAEVRCQASAIDALEQLVAVMRLGTRNARYCAGNALQELFQANHIKNHDSARHAIPPFMEMLRAGSEKEQKLALKVLAMLASDNQLNAMMIADQNCKCLEFICKTLWADCSLVLKEDAVNLCFVLFAFSQIRATPRAASCIEPLTLLAGNQSTRSAWSAVLHALNNLFDSPSFADIAFKYGTVKKIVGILTHGDPTLYNVSLHILVKLATNSYQCRDEMNELEVIEKVLCLLHALSDSGYNLGVSLLRLLTSTGSSLSVEVSTATDRLLSLLSRPGLDISGQFTTLQVLLNIFGRSGQLTNVKLSPSQPIKNLIVLLDSPSQEVQRLALDLFSQFLQERQLDQSFITKKVVLALIQLAADGVEKAVLGLETASTVMPQAVAEAGGISVVSKVITQMEPLPAHNIWEAASSVVGNILYHSPLYFWQVPVETFVRMLQSENKSTIVTSLRGMLTLQKENVSFAQAFAECGAIDALMDLLKFHQCEEASAEVLEILVNDERVRSMKATYAVVGPLANYLLDQDSKCNRAQLLSALALGDLFQQPGFSACLSDVVLAGQALFHILERNSPEDLKTVAFKALQNLLTNSHTTRHALAEAGAINIVRDLLYSSSRCTAGQGATLAKVLFSRQSVQEHDSTGMVMALSAALQTELSQGACTNEDILRAIAVMFSTFPKLCMADAATSCIPLVTRAMENSSDAVHDGALDIFCLMRQAWPKSSREVIKAQATSMANAIPVIQRLLKTGIIKFHERASTLLLSLPGNLAVIIKQGMNLKQSTGNTNAFCRVTLGNTAAKETKVVSHSTMPEWNQGFAWPFDAAPKGQKIRIECKNSGTFGKKTMGSFTILVDQVIALGTVTGNYTLHPNKNKDGTSRVLEIEIKWSP